MRRQVSYSCGKPKADLDVGSVASGAESVASLRLQQGAPAVWRRQGSSVGWDAAIVGAADGGCSGKRFAAGGAAGRGSSGRLSGRVVSL